MYKGVFPAQLMEKITFHLKDSTYTASYSTATWFRSRKLVGKRTGCKTTAAESSHNQ
jgi:hypothetical protein